MGAVSRPQRRVKGIPALLRLPARHNGDGRCLWSRWDGSVGLSLLSGRVVQVEDCR